MIKRDILRNIGYTIAIIILRISVDFAYFNELVVNFAYYGYKDYRNTINFLMSWVIMIIFIVPIIKLINKKVTFSNIIVCMISIISIIPFTTLIYSGMINQRFIIMNTIYWMILLVSYSYVSKKEIKPIVFKIKDTKITDKFALIIGILSVILILFISWKYTGFRLYFNFYNVYDLRMEARTYDFPIVIKYLFEWTRSINVIFLAYSLMKKKYFTAAVFFIAQMLSFGVDGLKSTFFMAILVLIFAIVYDEKKVKNFKGLCVYGITGLSLLGVLEKTLLKTSNLIDLIIRRVLIIPSYLNYCYVDFFSNNLPDYFKRSFLRILGFKTAYPDLEFQIGEIYFNRPLMRCNNGLISEAVTNFGILGIVIGPILFVLILRLMDKCTNGLKEKVFLIIALYFSIRLTDTFLTVALFTHGFLISVIIMTMLKNNTE